MMTVQGKCHAPENILETIYGGTFVYVLVFGVLQCKYNTDFATHEDYLPFDREAVHNKR